jgi:hypothetical protein
MDYLQEYLMVSAHCRSIRENWVPIVIEVFHPNGEAQNSINLLEIELDEDVYGGFVSGR